jgi:hypothetical protein
MLTLMLTKWIIHNVNINVYIMCRHGAYTRNVFGAIMKTILLSSVLLLSACSPGWQVANKHTPVEGTSYAWVGCHTVTMSPYMGAYAIGPGGDLPVGSKFYFKQRNPDGTVGEVVTGVPCD